MFVVLLVLRTRILIQHPSTMMELTLSLNCSQSVFALSGYYQERVSHPGIAISLQPYSMRYENGSLYGLTELVGVLVDLDDLVPGNSTSL